MFFSRISVIVLFTTNKKYRIAETACLDIIRKVSRWGVRDIIVF